MAGGLLRQEAIVVAVDSLEGFSSGSGIRDLTAEYEHVNMSASKEAATSSGCACSVALRYDHGVHACRAGEGRTSEV